MPDGLNGGQRRPLTPQQEFAQRLESERIASSQRPPLTPQEAEIAKAVNDRMELTRLLASNKAGFAEIAAMGAQVDGGSLLNGRIDTLAEMIFGGADSPGMLEFRLRFERMVSAALEEIRGQARKAQLAAGAHVSPQQVRQMAQQQGLLGPDGNPIRR